MAFVGCGRHDGDTAYDGTWCGGQNTGLLVGDKEHSPPVNSIISMAVALQL